MSLHYVHYSRAKKGITDLVSDEGVKKYHIKYHVMFKRKLVEYNFNFKGLIPNLDTA